ncbi:MAG: hypothetical protein B6244_13825 [Candidatus Cloacimonetes bacterium 4572_55]|nr:MAG: hypothetical protein B6244_13825 [Candidatus Cloacimonetes bacterium 4572_55]
MAETTVVMRSKDDKEVIGETLTSIFDQTYLDFELVNIDSGSTDGTMDIIKKFKTRVIQIKPEEYIPGYVLNMGMENSSTPYVVFVNSDCTPMHREWLENMVQALKSDEKVGAVYGRQIPRPDAWPIYRRDYDYAFPPDAPDTREALLGNESWYNFFSMASSGVKRSVWKEIPFSPHIQYSEDIEWAKRVREAGHRVAYVPTAVVAHSHNYTYQQCYKRFFEEGRADAQIFESSGWRESWLFYSFLPYCSSLARDVLYCLKRGEISEMCYSFSLRWAQKQGRYVGLKTGRKSSKISD